jgi:hypothetical protein
MENSNGYCPDCYYRKIIGTNTVGRGEFKYEEKIRKKVDMILNEDGYYECPSCHLQTVWVDKWYPYLWILKKRGTGRFRDMTHAELYSDVGGQNKRYLGGFEFYIKTLTSQRWKSDAGKWIEQGSWWDNYVEFLHAGKSKDYLKSLTYNEIMSVLQVKFEESPTKPLEAITLPIAIELPSSRLIKLYLENEVEMLPETHEKQEADAP